MALLAAAIAVLNVAEADLAVASITLLLVVVAASALGYAAGLVAALSASAALTYYFTPPLHSFAVGQPDDVVALVAFVTVSVLVGATVARLSELRRRSERAAREAHLPLALTNDLLAGIAREDVLHTLASELVGLGRVPFEAGRRDAADLAVLRETLGAGAP